MSEAPPTSSTQTTLLLGIALQLIACGVLIWKTYQPRGEELEVRTALTQSLVRMDELMMERDESCWESGALVALISQPQEPTQAPDSDNLTLNNTLADQNKNLQPIKLKRAKVEWADHISFACGSATFTLSGRAVLDQLAQPLRHNPSQPILIFGHSNIAPIGPQARSLIPSNRDLCATRAKTAVDFLKQQEIFSDPLIPIGTGAMLRSNQSTSEGRTKGSPDRDAAIRFSAPSLWRAQNIV